MTDNAAESLKPLQPIYQHIDFDRDTLPSAIVQCNDVLVPVRKICEALGFDAIGARLRAVLLTCGVSQEELAERLRIERVTLSRYESGARTLRHHPSPFAV